MTQQSISPEAAARREQARDDQGRFGRSAAAEPDLGSVDLGGDDLRSRVHDLVDGRGKHWLPEGSTPERARVSQLRPWDVLSGGFVVEHTHPSMSPGKTAVVGSYPAKKGQERETYRREWGTSTTVAVFYNAEDDLAEQQQAGDPRGEDWYDPDTDPVSQEERDERALSAVARLDEAADDAHYSTFQDETSRLAEGRRALARVFRDAQPHVARIQLERAGLGYRVTGATGWSGEDVDLEDGWPEGVDLASVNRSVEQATYSPQNGAFKAVYGPSGRVEVEISDGPAPF